MRRSRASCRSSRAFARTRDAVISIDTRKAPVARAALEAGADCVNDVTGGRFDEGLAPLLAEYGCGAILMHMKGTDPRRMQDDLRYDHLVADVASTLAGVRGPRRGRRGAAGGDRDRPGTRLRQEPSRATSRCCATSRPSGRWACRSASGASRKAFVRRFSGVPEDSAVSDRLPGSLAAVAAARRGGASILRVHDVAESVRFLGMLQAIARPPSAGRRAGRHRAPAR